MVQVAEQEDNISEVYSTMRFNGHALAAVELDAKSKNIVVFCHGYRSSSIGPNRFFVDASRLLAKYDISSIRFDQYGSGNSEGDFLMSSFDDWVETTKEIVTYYQNHGYMVCLFGQSMGGATVLKVASQIPKIAAIVSWVPDPNIEAFVAPKSGVLEEGGQIVKATFWQEAHDSKIVLSMASIVAPTYIVQCSDDEYVSDKNHQAILSHALPHHIVEMFPGYKHSSWTYEQVTIILNRSVDFIVKTLRSKLR